MHRNRMCAWILFSSFLVVSGAALAAERSPAKPSPLGTAARQRTPQSAGEMNRIPVRVQPQNIQAKLAAAMGAVDGSEQKLKAAVASMSAYLDREASCVGKSWTAQEMGQGCLPEDTLKICKEKLVAACAKARGPDKGKLWGNVQAAADDLAQKAQAVKSVYGSSDKLPLGVPGIGGIPSVF